MYRENHTQKTRIRLSGLPIPRKETKGTLRTIERTDCPSKTTWQELMGIRGRIATLPLWNNAANSEHRALLPWKYKKEDDPWSRNSVQHTWSHWQKRETKGTWKNQVYFQRRPFFVQPNPDERWWRRRGPEMAPYKWSSHCLIRLVKKHVPFKWDWGASREGCSEAYTTPGPMTTPGWQTVNRVWKALNSALSHAGWSPDTIGMQGIQGRQARIGELSPTYSTLLMWCPCQQVVATQIPMIENEIRTLDRRVMRSLVSGSLDPRCQFAT